MTAVRPGYDTYAQVFTTVYAGLVTNLLFGLACLPFVFGTGPATTWPALVLLAPTLAPALCAAFAVFSAFSADSTIPVARTFVRAWRRSGRRALTVGAAGCAVLGVLVVDVRVVWGRPVGALAIPVFATLTAIVLATILVSLVALAERPGARVPSVLGTAGFLAVRRWYLTAVSLTVLSLLAALVSVRPVIGLGLAAAPMLYLVWANTRYSLRPVLDLPSTTDRTST